MSGHSKWSTIKRRKGAQDAKRGKMFSRIIKEITVAARLGGGDPTGNPRLRTAVAAAKAENMPKDNIERAIKKGTGELEGVSYEEVIYEGYGPGGVAVLVDVLTDNKNRVVSEVRHIFARNGGSLGESGCVAWMFEKKGLLTFPKDSVSEDELMDAALEVEAEDVRETDTDYEVITEPGSFEKVKRHLEAKGLKPELAEVSMLPQATIKLAGKQAEQMLRLMEALEDNDDVQDAWANFDIPDAVMEAMQMSA